MIALGIRALINPDHIVDAWRESTAGAMVIELDSGEKLMIKNTELAEEIWGCLASTTFECKEGDIVWVPKNTKRSEIMNSD